MKTVYLSKREAQKPVPIARKVSKPRKLPLAWVESERFEVWLRVAREQRVEH